MKKRILSLILIAVLAFCLCLPAAAVSTQYVDISYRAIKIVINGKEITPCDEAGRTVEPFIMSSTGTTYMPVRAIAQALGLSVEWDNDTSTVKLSTGGTVKTGAGRPGATNWSGSMKITYRDIKIQLNGVTIKPLNAEGKSVEPFILDANSSTYLPLRAIAEALGLTVGWDNDTCTASISGTVGENSVKKLRLSATDVRGTVGDYFRLEAYPEPDSAVNRNVSWSSTNPKVAGVNSQGVVVMLGAGSADIIATAVNGVSAKCRVNVRGLAEDDPYDQELGYSCGEIKELKDCAVQAARTVADSFAACDEAEAARFMGPLYLNTAISRACQASAQLDEAAAFLKNGAPLPLEEGNYKSLLELVEAARGELEALSALKADSKNVSELLPRVREGLEEASGLIGDFEKAADNILQGFES